MWYIMILCRDVMWCDVLIVLTVGGETVYILSNLVEPIKKILRFFEKLFNI